MRAHPYIWNSISSFLCVSDLHLILAYQQGFFIFPPTGSLPPAQQINMEWYVCFAGSVLERGNARGCAVVPTTRVRRTSAPSPSPHLS